MESIELITVDLSTDTNLTGYGYAYTIGNGGSTIREMLEKELLPEVIGKDPTEVEFLWQKMYRKVHWLGRGGVVSFL